MVLRDLRRASLDIGFTLLYAVDADEAVQLTGRDERPVVVTHPAANTQVRMSVGDAQRLAEALRQPERAEDWSFDNLVIKTRNLDRARPCPSCGRPFWEEQQAIQVYQGDFWAGGIPVPNAELIHSECAERIAVQLDEIVEDNTADLLGDAL